MEEKNNRENLGKCPVCSSDDFVFLYDKKDYQLEIADRRVQCKNCGVIFIQNRLSSEFIIWKFYTKRNPIGPTEKYLERRKHLKKTAELMAKFLPKGAMIFDIGCGGGALLKFLADKGYKVSGLEVSQQAKDEAERVIGLKDVVRMGDFLEIDFAEETFDAVLMTDVIEHLHNPYLYLQKVLKILKPAGLLVVRTPNSGSLMHQLLKAQWTLASPRHIALYNSKSLSFLLKKNSFRIVDFHSEKGIQGRLIPPFSYGAVGVLRGFMVNLFRWISALIGRGESITVFAKKFTP